MLSNSRKRRGIDFPMVKWRSAVSERADIPLVRPIFSSELPCSVAPTPRDAPVFPLSPNVFLGKSDVRTRATKIQIHERTLPEGVLLDSHDSHPFFAFKTAHSPCGTGLWGPSKFFRVLWFQMRFSGSSRLCRVPKKVLCRTKPPSCTTHLLLCFYRRILVAYIFKVDMYWLWRWTGRQHTQQHTHTHTHTLTHTHTHKHTHILLRYLCGVRVCLMVWIRERVHVCMYTENPGISA
jgi:hypothetical protein